MTFSKTFEGNDGSLVMFQNTRMGSYQVAKVCTKWKPQNCTMPLYL
jgi:hypothetical protein